jgi:hypothetical protein
LHRLAWRSCRNFAIDGIGAIVLRVQPAQACGSAVNYLRCRFQFIGRGHYRRLAAADWRK